jgi:protoheme IX farnesyltransferase
MRRLTFSRFAWGLLFYNLAVIVWGAFVRASFSGDGCGAHWPNCGAALLPDLQHKPMMIEFAHRASSGLVLVFVLVMFVWALVKYPRNHPVRIASLASLLFTISEALVGAVLVKYQLVAHNPSVYRAFVISVHLTNTFLLLGALTLTAWWASGNAPIRVSRQGALGYALLLGFVGTLILGISGAITALGDMLFPAASLLQGLHDDLSPTAHFLVRLRLFHPLIATSVGLYLVLISGLASHLRPSESSRRFARWMGIAFFVEMSAGVINYLLKAPVWMQLVHLLLADGVWIVLVLVSAAALADNVLHTETIPSDPESERRREALGVATWKDYIALTKPRVISLLLFTTIAAMFIARPGFVTANGWHGVVLLFAVFVGGYMAGRGECDQYGDRSGY